MAEAKATREAKSTTGAGAPASSDRDSLTVGPDGPLLLHDVHFLEQMAHFNREKVPERQPHAKGAGAFGTFESTDDISAFTAAALFQKGAVTDMLARFSMVAGTALLGLSAGQTIDWPLPHGQSNRYRVVRIVHQPEAAGNLSRS